MNLVGKFNNKVLILKNIKPYQGIITLQYLPNGGIQMIRDNKMIINYNNGFIYTEEINYDNVDVVETAIRTILESNIFKYKEEFIVPTLVNTYSQFDANLKLIDTEVIKLSQDVDYIVNAYKEIVPVLMNKGFPYKKLSDLSKVATVNLSNFVNDSTAYAIIRTLRELNETSLVEGTIPYLVNMGKLMLNNENINKSKQNFLHN